MWIESDISKWTNNNYNYYKESSKYGDIHILWTIINKFKNDMKDNYPLEAEYSKDIIKSIDNNLENINSLYVLSGKFTLDNIKNKIDSKVRRYNINRNLTYLKKFEKIVENDNKVIKKWCDNYFNHIDYNLFSKYLSRLGISKTIIQLPSVKCIIEKYLKPIPINITITNTFKNIIFINWWIFR